MPQVGGPPGQQHVPVVMGYMMPSQPQYQTQTHPQGNRLRKRKFQQSFYVGFQKSCFMQFLWDQCEPTWLHKCK